MNTPEISYKTEAHVVLRDGMDTKNVAALQWRKGSGERVVINVGSEQIKLSASQLLQLASIAPTIAADVEPVAKFATLPSGLGGVK